MRVIEKIEINYFRSIYSATLSDCRDLNVILGGNDSGKSNLLRALNLFFNNETQLYRSFSFDEDFSYDRRDEVRQTQGRGFIWIKITFLNYEGWRSLPRRFAVKRQWNRYASQPDQTLPGNPDIPATTLGKFLSKIRFHYIPAVRGPAILQHYLRLLHDALLSDASAGISDSLEDLIRSVNANTEDMSSAIEQRLGFRSTIQRPSDLRELFAALDFSTSQGKFSVPLQFRGDGIQAHHIPFILQFIAAKSRNTHIWAYEEPENSLEMARSFQLARQFSDDLAEDNQIFLTTHSPAFYDISQRNSGKWLVRANRRGPGSDVRRLHSSTIADEEVGVAALVADRSRELYEQLAEAEDSAQKLASRVDEFTQPILVVEGPSDEIILQAAWRALHPTREQPFSTLSADGIHNVDSYLRFVVRQGLAPERPTIALIDDDEDGRKIYAKWGRYPLDDVDHFRLLSSHEPVLLGHLPTPEHIKTIAAKLRNSPTFTADSQLEFSIEQMFPPDVLQSAHAQGAIAFQSRRLRIQQIGLDLRLDLTDQARDYLSAMELVYLQEVEKSCKMQFARWVNERSESINFRSFQTIFDPILRHIR